MPVYYVSIHNKSPAGELAVSLNCVVAGCSNNRVATGGGHYFSETKSKVFER